MLAWQVKFNCPKCKRKRERRYVRLVSCENCSVPLNIDCGQVPATPNIVGQCAALMETHQRRNNGQQHGTICDSESAGQGADAIGQALRST